MPDDIPNAIKKTNHAYLRFHRANKTQEYNETAVGKLQ